MIHMGLYTKLSLYSKRAAAWTSIDLVVIKEKPCLNMFYYNDISCTDVVAIWEIAPVFQKGAGTNVVIAKPLLVRIALLH